MKLNQLLIGGFLAVALLVGFVGWFGLKTSQQITSSFSGLSEEFQQDVDAAIEASSYAKRAEGHLMLYLVLDSETDKDKFSTRHELLEEQIDTLYEVVITPETREQVNTLKSASEDMLKYGNQLIETHKTNPKAFDTQNNAELIRKFHNASALARKVGVEIAKLETSRTRSRVKEAQQNAALLQQEISALLTATLILAVVIGLFISHSISKPLRKITENVDEISKGNFEVDIAATGKIQEISQLSESLSRITKTMKLAVLEKGHEKKKKRRK